MLRKKSRSGKNDINQIPVMIFNKVKCTFISTIFKYIIILIKILLYCDRWCQCVVENDVKREFRNRISWRDYNVQ